MHLGRDLTRQQKTEVERRCECDAPPTCNGIVHARHCWKCCTRRADWSHDSIELSAQ